MKRLAAAFFFFILAGCLTAGRACAAIAFDRSDVGTLDVAGTTWALNFNATVSAGSGRVLIVAVMSEGANASADTMTHTGATFNSVAMTQIGSTYQTNTSTPNDYVSMWYMLNPPVGTYALVASGTKNPGTGTGYIRAGTTVLQNVKQQAPEASATNKGNGTAPTVSITTLSDNAWIVDTVVGGQGGQDITANAAQTERWERTSNVRGNGSTKATTTRGANSTAWSTTPAEDWGVFATSWVAARRQVLFEDE
jgi:hypothetical protein